MALKGTIRDFGIADIFQLISQQTKTGVLILRDHAEEVKIYFHDGAVVRAESISRPKQMLLGAMLVNAELITKDQLDQALKEQSQTLVRLGAVLIAHGRIDEPTLVEIVRLQITETVYRLFLWESGTYEFEQTDVGAPTDSLKPLRAENLLMEGLRMMDEWPAIRRRLPSYAVTFDRVRPLPEAKDSQDLDLDAAFAATPDAQKTEDVGHDLGPSERRVYQLIEPERPLLKIINLSQLGEFETCRAVLALMSSGFIREVDLSRPEREARPPRRSILLFSVREVFGRTAVWVLLGLFALVLLRYLEPIRTDPRTVRVEDRTVQHLIASSQMRVLKRAIEVYRMSFGRYPSTLDEVAKAGLISERDVRWPFARPYHFYVREDRVLLEPPLF